MTRLVELTAAVPDLLRDTVVPFTGGRVGITAAQLVQPGEQSITVRVTFFDAEGGSGTFEFVVDDSWQFDTSQDVIDQLLIDLVEHLDSCDRAKGSSSS